MEKGEEKDESQKKLKKERVKVTDWMKKRSGKEEEN